MRPQQITHDICRLYLKDLLTNPSLSPEERAAYLSIEGYLRARNIAALSSVSQLLGSACQTSHFFRTLLQIEAFYKKNAAFSDDERCTAAARESFLDSERRCRITNRRLDWYYLKPERLAPDLKSYLSKMEKFISTTLGSFEVFLENLPKELRVTDGATASSSRRKSLPFMKIKRSYECPDGTIPYIQTAAKYFGMPVPKIKVSPVNRVEVVPKNWKTYRTIACEPDGAMPFQLAFDGYCKRRLRRIGIDLSSQLKNQDLAKEGSITDCLATIDLSAASDTVSYNVVAWLFPLPWFNFLDAVRSRSYKGPFGTGNYAKFSSMGNGSTFTIETLIFAAACSAVGSKRRVVYGDDIVIESSLAEPLLRLLKFLGFVVNQDKSYVSGPYRESCGSHWYLGSYVTPFFVRDEFSKKSELCHLVNGLADISLPRGHLWKYLIAFVQRERLPLVPFNESTTSGVHVTPGYAHSLGLIRVRTKRHAWIAMYRAYVSKSNMLHIYDSRTLFLWYLDAFRGADSREVLSRSRSSVSLSTHKFVRKWVCWVPPARPLPVHLYWWTEDLVSP